MVFNVKFIKQLLRNQIVYFIQDCHGKTKYYSFKNDLIKIKEIITKQKNIESVEVVLKQNKKKVI